MKTHPNYKGYKLKEIVPTAIALVTEGANRRKFCLFKLKQAEGVSMKKETAIALIKGGHLTDEEVATVIESVAEADRAEVKKVADELKKAAGSEIDLDKLATTVADKIVKAQEASLKQIVDSLKATTTTLEKLAAPKKEDGKGSEEDKELSDEEIAAQIEKACKDEEGN